MPQNFYFSSLSSSHRVVLRYLMQLTWRIVAKNLEMQLPRSSWDCYCKLWCFKSDSFRIWDCVLFVWKHRNEKMRISVVHNCSEFVCKNGIWQSVGWIFFKKIVKCLSTLFPFHPLPKIARTWYNCIYQLFIIALNLFAILA